MSLLAGLQFNQERGGLISFRLIHFSFVRTRNFAPIVDGRCVLSLSQQVQPAEERNSATQNPHRFSKRVFWLGLGFLVLLAIFLLLMPVPFQSARLKELCDLVHLPLFAVLTWLTLLWREWRDGWNAQKSMWKVPLFWLIAGSLLEFSQKFFDRGTSLQDAVSNAIGIVVGWLIFYAHFRTRGTMRLGLFVCAITLLSIGWGWAWYQLFKSFT